jgi:hypothetical protein
LTHEILWYLFLKILNEELNVSLVTINSPIKKKFVVSLVWKHIWQTCGNPTNHTCNNSLKTYIFMFIQLFGHIGCLVNLIFFIQVKQDMFIILVIWIQLSLWHKWFSPFWLSLSIMIKNLTEFNFKNQYKIHGFVLVQGRLTPKCLNSQTSYFWNIKCF